MESNAGDDDYYNINAAFLYFSFWRFSPLFHLNTFATHVSRRFGVSRF
jgi:hypothetical protein